MKRLPSTYGIIALAALLVSGCGERQASETTGTPVAEEMSGSVPSEREPIRNTTPEGSTMDPTSNAYIVFDGSGSMAGQPIEQAKSAVAAFIAGAPEDLNIGLYVFDNAGMDGREIAPLGRGAEQRQMLKNQISRIQAGGGTPLGSAIQVGTEALIKQFQKQLRYGDIRLIVVTDGAASDPDVFRRSISSAGNFHVPIYTVGFRIGGSHPLRQFSEAYFTADDEQELLDAMQETLAELDDSTALDL